MIFEINGIDMVPYIANGGVKWQRSDVDGAGAGRDLNGLLRRNRVATKIRLDVTCRPLKANEVKKVLTAIMPEWVDVRYTDPQAGVVVRRMYSNNNPASYLMQKSDGTEWWAGVSFPLVER